MQLTLHATRRTPHGASRLVQAMSAWLVKIRRAPSGIVGMRGFNSYGHTTTVMHEMSTHLSPSHPNPCTDLLRTAVESRFPVSAVQLWGF